MRRLLTTSVPINHISWLWNLLFYNLDVNCWKVTKKEHMIACAHCLINIKTHTISDQEILTNKFKTNNINVKNPDFCLDVVQSVIEGSPSWMLDCQRA